MPTKYAIRITEDNLALIFVLSPIVDVAVKENLNRFFLFTVDDHQTTTQHDIVQEDDLEIYDGMHSGRRIIIQ